MHQSVALRRVIGNSASLDFLVIELRRSLDWSSRRQASSDDDAVAGLAANDGAISEKPQHLTTKQKFCVKLCRNVKSDRTPENGRLFAQRLTNKQQQEKSDKYADDQYEYRHVILPKEQAKNIPTHRLLSDAEWRALGVQQSRGWMHYATHRPEPHILLFRRPLGTDPTTGEIRADLAEQARKEFEAIYGRRDEVA